MVRSSRPTPPAPKDQHLRLEQVAEGVHAAISVPGGAAFSNAGVVDLGGLGLVFDATLTPHSGAELRAAAVRILGSTPAYLIYSHYHGDHVRGAQAFAGTHVVATGTTRDLLRTAGPDEAKSDAAVARKMLDDLRSDPKVEPAEKRLFSGYYQGIIDSAPDLAIVLPDLTFTNQIEFHGRKRTAQLATFGGGHTRSDVVLVLPDDKVAYLGDLVFSRHHPWMSDGNAPELLRVLGKIRELSLRRIVPGHGPVGPPEEVDRMAEYVRQLGKTVRRVRDAGGTEAMAAQLPVPTAYRTWAHRSFYPENLRFMFGQPPIL